MPKVTILILIDGFLQYKMIIDKKEEIYVTILILIDGFLQYKDGGECLEKAYCHNPYFNRWFSAMWVTIADMQLRCVSVTILILIDGFLQYLQYNIDCYKLLVTILILIDGFLQLKEVIKMGNQLRQSQSLF